jgi:2-amino-4-hydroxy-6-hydroxymethyldihydropteridine diphosphokinase
LSKPTVVAIALGSNLGDRDAHLDFAAARLALLLDHPRFSSRYDTDPVGTPDPQLRYLNAAVVGTWWLDPQSLLSTLLAIEAARGRERPYANAPRTLDLDLILYADRVLEEEALTLPHPRFRERRFVLQPLAEIAPDLVDPVSGLTISALLGRLVTKNTTTENTD